NPELSDVSLKSITQPSMNTTLVLCITLYYSQRKDLMKAWHMYDLFDSNITSNVQVQVINDNAVERKLSLENIWQRANESYEAYRSYIYFRTTSLLTSHQQNNLATSLIMPSSLLQVVNSLFQTCYNNWEQLAGVIVTTYSYTLAQTVLACATDARAFAETRERRALHLFITITRQTIQYYKGGGLVKDFCIQLHTEITLYIDIEILHTPTIDASQDITDKLFKLYKKMAGLRNRSPVYTERQRNTIQARSLLVPTIFERSKLSVSENRKIASRLDLYDAICTYSDKRRAEGRCSKRNGLETSGEIACNTVVSYINDNTDSSWGSSELSIKMNTANFALIVFFGIFYFVSRLIDFVLSLSECANSSGSCSFTRGIRYRSAGVHACARINSPGFKHISMVSCHSFNFFFSVKCLSFDNKEVFLTKRSSSNAGQCGLKPDIKELKDLLLEVKNEISDLKDEFSHEMKALWKYINAGKCHKQITDKNQGLIKIRIINNPRANGEERFSGRKPGAKFNSIPGIARNLLAKLTVRFSTNFKRYNLKFVQHARMYISYVCSEPKGLGMRNGLISDSQISASSQWDSNHSPSNSRLFYAPHNGRTGAWSSKTNDINQWLQIDFKQLTAIVGVNTQGRAGNTEFVKSYTLSYRQDGLSFQAYKPHGLLKAKVFNSNTDIDSVVHHSLPKAITARYIRVHPKTWHGHISMRVEFHGCYIDCKDPGKLGLENGRIRDGQISASSNHDSNHRAQNGRLNFIAHNGRTGAWSAKVNDVKQWLQVDLEQLIVITGISTQGRADCCNQFVKTYIVSYSNDGAQFQPYKDQNQIKQEKEKPGKNCEKLLLHALIKKVIKSFIQPAPVFLIIMVSTTLIASLSITHFISYNPNLRNEDDAIKFIGQKKTVYIQYLHTIWLSLIHGFHYGQKNATGETIELNVFQHLKISRLEQDLRSNDEERRVLEGDWLELGNPIDLEKTLHPCLYISKAVFNTLGQYQPRFLNAHWNGSCRLFSSRNHLKIRYRLFQRISNLAVVGGKTLINSIVAHDHQGLKIKPCHIGHKVPKEQAEAIVDKLQTVSSSDLKKIPLMMGEGAYLCSNIPLVTTALHNILINAIIQASLKMRIHCYLSQCLMFLALLKNYFRCYNWGLRRHCCAVFSGNTDKFSMVHHDFSSPIFARYIRIQPKTWNGHISLRMELFGCYKDCVGTKDLGMRSGNIQVSQITASSEWDSNHRPNNARLFFTARNGRTGAWSSKTNDLNQWLQIDFKRQAVVVGISTQGREDCCSQWVKTYTLYYSINGVSFFPYKHHSQVKVFNGRQKRYLSLIVHSFSLSGDPRKPNEQDDNVKTLVIEEINQDDTRSCLTLASRRLIGAAHRGTEYDVLKSLIIELEKAYDDFCVANEEFELLVSEEENSEHRVVNGEDVNSSRINKEELQFNRKDSITPYFLDIDSQNSATSSGPPVTNPSTQIDHTPTSPSKEGTKDYTLNSYMFIRKKMVQFVLRLSTITFLRPPCQTCAPYSSHLRLLSKKTQYRHTSNQPHSCTVPLLSICKKLSFQTFFHHIRASPLGGYNMILCHNTNKNSHKTFLSLLDQLREEELATDIQSSKPIFLSLRIKPCLRDNDDFSFMLKHICTDRDARHFVNLVSLPDTISPQPTPHHSPNSLGFNSRVQKLESFYEDVGASVQAALEDLHKIKAVPTDDYKGLVELVDEVESAYSQLEELGNLNVLTLRDVDLITELLPCYLKVEWRRRYRDITAIEKIHPFIPFMHFLEGEREAVSRIAEYQPKGSMSEESNPQRSIT
ncbi:Hypothetical predicted protein, partial [Paramuricea clavata]